jgi:hypothetical protein
MSSSADIRKKWQELVFNNEKILKFTESIYSDDILGNQDSTCDLSKAMHCAKINFVQWFVQRHRRWRQSEIGNCSGYLYRVRVDYILQVSNDQSTFNQIQDFFEALDDVVNSHLGATWGGLVNGSNPDQRFPNIIPIAPLNGELTVMGTYNYLAEL